MMVAIRTALEDDSCREEAHELIEFVYKDLRDMRFAYQFKNPGVAWRIMREVGKDKSKTIREEVSCFSSHDDRPMQKAAKLMGVKLELSDIPPM